MSRKNTVCIRPYFQGYHSNAKRSPEPATAEDLKRQAMAVVVSQLPALLECPSITQAISAEPIGRIISARTILNPQSDVQPSPDQVAQGADLGNVPHRAEPRPRGDEAPAARHQSRHRGGGKEGARAPGHTPKSSIQRNLAKLGLLDSPAKEAAIPLLEDFFYRYAEGRDLGLFCRCSLLFTAEDPRRSLARCTSRSSYKWTGMLRLSYA